MLNKEAFDYIQPGAIFGFGVSSDRRENGLKYGRRYRHVVCLGGRKRLCQ